MEGKKFEKIKTEKERIAESAKKYAEETKKRISELAKEYNLSMNKFIENMADGIGSEKVHIIQYLAQTNFENIDRPLLKNLLEKKIVFSQDVKKAKLGPELFFQNISENPSLWGRERTSRGVVNITDYITLGRPDGSPYKGWEYVAAERYRGVLGGAPYIGWEDVAIERSKEEVNFIENVDKILEFQGGIDEEPGLAEAKKRLDYVKEHLPPSLNKRLDNIFKTLEEWRKEVKDIEQEYGRLLMTSGAYVRFDEKLDVNKSFQGRLPFSDKEYKNLYDYLDRGFKAPSQPSNLIGKGIETLYDFMIKNREEYLKEKRNLEYLMSHQKELSPEEIKTLERKSKNILNSFEIMESIYGTPRGVYLSTPVLHGGARGEDARGWEPRTYAFRDNVFYRVEKNGKENYVNVKEYHLKVLRDDLKIRLYSFSDKPAPKNLGEEGLSLEIERNGETRFLSQKEAENFLKELKEYTLITLYFKNSPSLKVEKENK